MTLVLIVKKKVSNLHRNITAVQTNTQTFARSGLVSGFCEYLNRVGENLVPAS